MDYQFTGMELNDRGHPLCFLIWETKFGDKSDTQLVRICTDRETAEYLVAKRNKYFNEEEVLTKWELEEAEMDHYFGSSVIYNYDNIQKMHKESHETFRRAEDKFRKAEKWEILDKACDPFDTWVDFIELLKGNRKL